MKGKSNRELYGIIRYGSEDDAEAAIVELNGRDVQIVDLLNQISKISNNMQKVFQELEKEKEIEG